MRIISWEFHLNLMSVLSSVFFYCDEPFLRSIGSKSFEGVSPEKPKLSLFLDTFLLVEDLRHLAVISLRQLE